MDPTTKNILLAFLLVIFSNSVYAAPKSRTLAEQLKTTATQFRMPAIGT